MAFCHRKCSLLFTFSYNSPFCPAGADSLWDSGEYPLCGSGLLILLTPLLCQSKFSRRWMINMQNACLGHCLWEAQKDGAQEETRGGYRLTYGPDTYDRREEERLSTQSPNRDETISAMLMGNTQSEDSHRRGCLLVRKSDTGEFTSGVSPKE